MGIDEIINNKKEYSYACLKKDKKTLHIGYGIDDYYTRCMGVSIVSICKNNMNSNLIFHVIASSLSGENLKRIESIAKENGVNIYIYFIEESFFATLPTREFFPLAMYYRLILPLCIEADYLLYLDADIVCLKNIDSLFKKDIHPFSIAAVSDIETTRVKRVNALQLVTDNYFNSGVLYIDTYRWKKNNIFTEVLKVLSEKKDRLQYPDQDALNIIFQTQTYFLERNWNWIFSLGDNNISDAIFVHFTTHPKPWNIVWKYRAPLILRDIYSQYEALSPWKDAPLDLPNQYKHIKWYAYGLFCDGLYREGMKWYILYLKTKFRK